ncbi:hypothetical protein F3Y22_tig00111131pilonHSYRG00203 [Hibiscus syriacus]|uniref:NTF2 domain-containing protein n=1 Tax=Hibiscus syriacus TaxID=106335 RepID=A0A6A2YYA8_HIBSY|nr:hypothetical protein F3Y22_tig00111131pilonHSYRG00203 [Hibiscus syriacus]
MDAKSSVCSTPQEAAAVFVDRYYLVLRDSPEEIHKFYNDSSMVSRPGPDDIMATFTTIQHIKKHLLSSFGCKQFHIVSCDSQLAANQGVFVVVTGSFTTNIEQIIKFNQSFILSPMETTVHDYFISNDILKFLDDKEWITPNVSTSSSTTDLFLEEDFSTSDVSKAGSSLSSHDIPAVSSSVQEDTPAIYVEDVSSVVWSPHQDVPTVEDVSIVVQSDVSTLPVADDSTTVSSLAQHDEPILNENDAQFKPPPIRKSVRVLQEPKKSGLEGENKNMNTGNVKAGGTSIFVGNLATGSKPEQLHEAFKRFGPIKSNGVQIKLDRNLHQC